MRLSTRSRQRLLAPTLAAPLVLVLVLLAQLFGPSNASLVVRAPAELNVTLIEEPMAFSLTIGDYPTSTYSPSRLGRPVTYLDDALAESICEVFQRSDGNLSSLQDLAGQILIYREGLDFMCSGTIGNFANYKYLEKWCVLNATIVELARYYIVDMTNVDPADNYKEILSGDAAEAVRGCLWAKGEYEDNDAASRALELIRGSPGTFVGDIVLRDNWRYRPWPWQVWKALVGLGYITVGIIGLRTMYHRVQNGHVVLGEHTFVIIVDAGVAFVIGGFRIVSTLTSVSMSATLFVYQCFFTLGGTTSLLLIAVYADAVARLTTRRRRGAWLRRLLNFLALSLVVGEIFIDIIIMESNTGHAERLIALITSVAFVLQSIAVAELWRQTSKTIKILKDAQTMAVTGRFEPQNFLMIINHLHFWVRVSVIAAAVSCIMLFVLAVGVHVRYELLRCILDLGRVFSLLSEIKACRSMRQYSSRTRRRLRTQKTAAQYTSARRNISGPQNQRQVHPGSVQTASQALTATLTMQEQSDTGT